MIATTVAIYGVGTALCGFSQSLTQLIFFRSITGLAWAADGHPDKASSPKACPPTDARDTRHTCRRARRSECCWQRRRAVISHPQSDGA